MTDKTWYLQQVDIFRGLSDTEVEGMGPMMEPRTYRPGELLVGPDTPAGQIYVVKTGRVRLFHRGPGSREITAGEVGRGSLLGLSTLFRAAQDGFLNAEALTDVLVCSGDGRAFLEAITRWPQVMLNLALQLGAQLVQTEAHLSRAGSIDARTRLAGVLHRLAQDAGEPVPGGLLIRGALTHDELARRIGATRETVTRALGSLQNAGAIGREGRKIVVRDLQRLAAISGLD